MALIIEEGLKENASEMRYLVENNIITIKSNQNGLLFGLSFCFTGELQSIKRTDAQLLVTDNGGIIKSSVTKDLNYLVTNDTESGSSKNQKAAKPRRWRRMTCRQRRRWTCSTPTACLAYTRSV